MGDDAGFLGEIRLWCEARRGMGDNACMRPWGDLASGLGREGCGRLGDHASRLGGIRLWETWRLSKRFGGKQVGERHWRSCKRYDKNQVRETSEIMQEI